MGSKRKRVGREATTESQPSYKRSKKAVNGNGAPDAETFEKRPFTDQPSLEERKREAELYDLLGSEDGNDRLAAADCIVGSLLGEKGSEPVPEHVMLRHLDHRLLRGLTSGRNASRVGFSLALTEILSQLFGSQDMAAARYPGLSIEKILELLVAKTSGGGNIPGQEERDCLLGQVFGLECFVRSGSVFVDKSKWFQVLELLMQLYEKKTWLRSQIGLVLVHSFSLMSRKLAEKSLKKLAGHEMARTADGVGVWLAALDRHADMKVPKKPWTDPLTSPYLPGALRNSRKETDGEGGNRKQGNATAQLHFCWDLIYAYFVKLGNTTGSEAGRKFRQFWTTAVDENLFSKSASDQQKFSGFMVFQKAMATLSEHAVFFECLFSKNLMACLANQASNEDRYLHRAAMKSLKKMEETAEKHAHLLPMLLEGLLFKNGTFTWDLRSNTKTIDKLLQHAQAPLATVLDILQRPVATQDEAERCKYYEALGSYLLRLANSPEDPSAIPVLTDLAWSECLSENIRKSLRTKTMAAFARLTKRPENLEILCGAILRIDTQTGLGKDKLAAVKLAESLEILQDLLDPKNKVSEAPRQAMALLFAVALLQFYNEEPDAVDLLDELGEFYDKAKRGARKGGDGMAEFLVEILLAQVSRQSALTRQAAQQAFGAFTGHMTTDALKLLTGPLAAEENEKGHVLLFRTEQEDIAMGSGKEEQDGSSHDSLDSDLELLDVDMDSSSGESDEGKGDVADEADDELQALNKALAHVLQSRPPDKDEDEDDSDGSDMTDSEMMAMDEKLAEIFRQRGAISSKKSRQDAKEVVQAFKRRILDMLEIFVRKEADVLNPLAFDLLRPLLSLIHTTSTKSLASRACEIIIEVHKRIRHALRQVRSGQLSVKVEGENLLRLLEEISAGAGEDRSHVFGKAVSTASLAVASTLLTMPGWTDKVFDAYNAALVRFYRGELKMQPSFFVDWLNFCQAHAITAAQRQEQDSVVSPRS